MSKFNSKRIDYHIAIVCNIPLFLIPFVTLLFWHLGAYRNDDGYSVIMIVVGVGLVYILPSLVISILLLLWARRERKKGSNEFAKLSVIYGISASIFLAFWLLVAGTEW